LGVLQEGLELCAIHGQDPEPFRTAACFHDLFRGIAPEELRTIAEREGLEPRYWDSPNLAHGKLAALAMEREYGITDPDILNAVCYHTTGRPAMSKLEQILYIADASERGREYPGVETLRKLARNDLNEACLWSMNSTIAFVEARGQQLDPDTLRARDHLLAQRDPAK
ncbi:MAG: bis(5'-nucleosyl)-tetraphosphatase (symmetrical) YqeK, partial [Firmicutes bacterium]|nr:bis(5'-nucleosyl)-tetraphosphatase (symmetrical) YqeK [Bacillota bacterium]